MILDIFLFVSWMMVNLVYFDWPVYIELGRIFEYFVFYWGFRKYLELIRTWQINAILITNCTMTTRTAPPPPAFPSSR